MLKPHKQTRTHNKAKNKNLVDGVELVRVVEGPPPVGRGRVGVNFAVHLHNNFDVDADDADVDVDLQILLTSAWAWRGRKTRWGEGRAQLGRYFTCTIRS